MPLTVELKQQPDVPLEVDWLSPCSASGYSIHEMMAKTIFHGNRQVEFGEFFRMDGDASDRRLIWQGDLSNVHWIGKRMSAGTLVIEGSVGRHLGSEMTGGKIDVGGDASDWVGGEMTGGNIRIAGNAGHMVGAAYRGSPVGVRGGTILIEGSAGYETGHSMRRGLIAIAGNVGDLVGFNMLAGSIIVFGDCGIRPGAGMKRGTLGLFGQIEKGLLPTFRSGATIDTVVFRLIARELQEMGFATDVSPLLGPLSVFHGDLLEGGRGEILTTGNP